MVRKRSHAGLTLLALVLLAPALATVIIAVLLLFGVEPHLVFLPGHFVRSRLEGWGFHPHNRVGVLATVMFWWVIIIVVWVTLRRLWRREA